MSQDKSTITNASTLLDFFRQELEAASHELGVKTTDETQAYLIHMLDGYTKPEQSRLGQLGFERAAALMLSDAVYSEGERRIEAYRQLGDACLYNCGFFQERLTRRHLRVEYYQQVGRTAYKRLAELMGLKRHGGLFHHIFDELAMQFELLTQALRQMASTFTSDGRARQLWERIRQEHPQGLFSAAPLTLHKLS